MIALGFQPAGVKYVIACHTQPNQLQCSSSCIGVYLPTNMEVLSGDNLVKLVDYVEIYLEEYIFVTMEYFLGIFLKF